MPPKRLPNVALAILVGLAFTGFARAQEPVAGNGLPNDGVSPYGYPGNGVTSSTVQKPKRFGCWASHLSFGCGSLKSECTFIFGSCRQYFGEGCRKTPPPTYGPIPPVAGFALPIYGPGGYAPPGYGPPPSGGCACP